MRKNSIRKLIHGILDLLPLFVIPIFAININQKSVEPIQVEVQEKISVDFNQLVPDDINEDSTSKGVTFDWVNSEVTASGTATGGNANNTKWINGLTVNHKYALYIPNFNSVDNHYIIQMFSTFVRNEYAFFRATGTGGNIQYYIYNGYESLGTFKYNLFDLTKMGLEDVTREELKVMFPLANYPYTESQKMLVNKPTTTIYNDTDIGSQFLYSLYISTDNYFNMNNVFNLNSVYSWFEMNIFGGSAPLSIYIVWNIIIYELVMDLLMLLYALFMFFIDACQKLIDRPLESIK